MRKSFTIILIFFLFFILHFNLVKASATHCTYYVDGICMSWYYFDSREYETEEAPPQQPQVPQPEVPFQETRTFVQNVPPEFITLLFQFFGIVILLIILVILLQSIIEVE